MAEISSDRSSRLSLQESAGFRLEMPAPEKPAFDPALFEPIVFGEEIEVLLGVNRPFVEPAWPIKILRTAGEVAALARSLRSKDLLSLDTETSIRTEDRIAAEQKGVKPTGDPSAQLCWIQIGEPAQRRLPVKKDSGVLPGLAVDLRKPGKTYLISVVALHEEARQKSAMSGEEINPLKPLMDLFNRELPVSFIIQYAAFERRQGAKFGIAFNCVEDTFVLAKELRPDLARVRVGNLSALSLEILGEPLSKEEQLSNWDTAEPSQSQLPYLALDVEQCAKIWGAITASLNSARAEAQEVLASRDEEKIAYAIRDCIRERYALVQNSGIADPLVELEAEAIACEDYLKKTLLPLEYARRKEELGEAFEPQEGFSYSGPFGTAGYRVCPASRIDIEKLRAFDSSLASEVVRLKTTKDRVAAAKKSLGRERIKELELPSNDEIWRLIRRPGSSGEASLLMNLIDLPVEPDPRALAAVPELPEEMTVSGCLKRIIECRLTALKLVREAGIGNERGRLACKQRLLEEGLLKLMVEAHPDPEDSGYRTVLSDGSEIGFVQKIRMVVDFSVFHDTFPELYEARKIEVKGRVTDTVTEEVTKASVAEALKSRGFDEEQIEAVLQQVCVPSDKPARPRMIGPFPSYAVYYRGYKEDARERLFQKLEVHDAGEEEREAEE